MQRLILRAMITLEARIDIDIESNNISLTERSHFSTAGSQKHALLRFDRPDFHRGREEYDEWEIRGSHCIECPE